MTTTQGDPPLPPTDLAAYVGDRFAEDPVWSYLHAGRSIRAAIEQVVDTEWSWEGKRILDFGCGSGRVLRHFLTEASAPGCSFVGCDIHAPSIDWLNEHFSPPLTGVVNDEAPPAPFDDASFDLIWATSVFTHLTDHWAGWLLELHRVLKPDGILIATILSEPYAPLLMDRPWDEDRIGMTVLGYGAPWDAGGPMVLHSEWWLRSHWGRAFEVEHFQRGGFAASTVEGTQGVVRMRKRNVTLRPEGLEAIEPDEPREIAALEFALSQTRWERADLNRRHDEYAHGYRQLSEDNVRLREAYDRAAAEKVARAGLAGVAERAVVAARHIRRRPMLSAGVSGVARERSDQDAKLPPPALSEPTGTRALPLPPAELAEYVGERTEDPVHSYENSGRSIRQHIELLLGPDWSWEGKRVLDFGCGSGRVLRHFVPEARAGIAEFGGADIHGPSVEWLSANLNPPIRAVQSQETPPLPFEDASFDLVWSTSVFSHLTDHWAAWLLELHRLLKPTGIVIATFISEAYNDILTHEPWDENRIGMNVLGYNAPWEAGGPMVLHSEWWLRAHYGRAFEIEHLQTGGFVSPDTSMGQGVLKMRRRDVSLTVQDLEAVEPDERRELIALRHSLQSTQRERADIDTKFRSAIREATELRALMDGSRAYRAAGRLTRFSARARRLAAPLHKRRRR